MNRQHQWARDTFVRVQHARDLTEEWTIADRDQYRTFCRQLPVLFRRSGLAQSLTYLNSRNDNRGGAVLRDVASVYGTTAIALVPRVVGTDERPVPVADYLIVSRDLIAIAGWFRRFADSVLPAPETSDSEGAEEAR